ncbi:MAG: tetratricopeptide repeat protein [Vicinamibacterales bacterium]
MHTHRRRRATGLFVVMLCAAILATAGPAWAQSGAVRGSVVDVDGQPIKGAVIKATSLGGRPPAITAATDAKGRFAMIGLASGAWTFRVEAPGFVPQDGRSVVRSTVTGNAPVEFVLTRALPPVPATLTRQVDADLEAADALRADGKFDQAIAAYQAIAEKNPALTSVQLVIGDAWRQKAARDAAPARAASLDRALAAFTAVLKAEPEHERARIEAALTLLAKGDAAEAEALVAGGALVGASRELVYALAEVRFGKGDTQGAEELFKRAAGMDPGWLRPRLQLGLLALRKGDKPAAAEIFKAVAAAGPDSSEAQDARRYLGELGP